MIRRYGAFPSIIALLILLAACSGEEELKLPPQRALSEGPQYIVAEPSYTRLHESPSIESGVTGYLRRGDIAEVVRESEFTDILSDRAARWYEVDATGRDGWVFGGFVSLHESHAQAERFSIRLLESRTGESLDL